MSEDNDTQVHIVTNESDEAAIRKSIEQLGAIPKADLKRLIEQWRMHQYKDGAFYRGRESCADELEEVIDDE